MFPVIYSRHPEPPQRGIYPEEPMFRELTDTRTVRVTGKPLTIMTGADVLLQALSTRL